MKMNFRQTLICRLYSLKQDLIFWTHKLTSHHLKSIKRSQKIKQIFLMKMINNFFTLLKNLKMYFKKNKILKINLN